MVKKKEVIQSGIWQILNAALKIFSQFAYYAVLARILPNAKVQLGIFAILNSFMNIGNILGDGGMGDALLQKQEHDKQHVNAAFYSGLLISVILYILLFFASPFIAEFYSEDGLSSALRIFATVFIFGAMSSASLNLLQKNFKFKKIFIGDGIFLLLSNVLGIVLVYAGMNYMALVYSQLFYFGAKFLLFIYYEPLPLAAGFKKHHWKEMVGYGSGLTLIRVNNYIANFGIVLEVGKLVSKAMLGIFDRTYRIMNIPQRFLYDTVQRVMMPAMVKKMGGNKGVYSVFERTLSVMNSLMIPLTAFLIIFSKQIVIVLLGPNWLDAVLLMQIFFLNLPLRMGASLGDTLMRVHGLIKVNLYRKIINSVAVCIFIYIGFLLDGLVGIGWGLVASTVLSYIQMMLVIKKRIYPDQWKELLFKPFYRGFILTISWIIPSYLIYLLANLIVNDALVSFICATSVLGLAVAAAFLKKPHLLGADVVYIQGDIVGMFNKKKKNKAAKKQLKQENEVSM